jgi:hypothetical protein
MTFQQSSCDQQRLSAPEVLKINAKFIKGFGGQVDPSTPFIAAANVDGRKSPLFWVFQRRDEFQNLAAALGEDQPIFALKSTVLYADVEWCRNNRWVVAPDLLDEVSQVYKGDIARIADGRTYLLGGNCNASLIATRIAQQMPRKPECLFVMNPLADAGHYSGPVELLLGEKEEVNFEGFEFGPSAFPDGRRTRLTGAHGTYFDSDQIGIIAEAITRHALTL